MTNPVNAVTDTETGSRWYVHPVTGERFISVTTVLSHVAKYGLPDWSAKLTAEAAFARGQWLAAIGETGLESCNALGDDRCGQCKKCAIAWLANRHNDARDTAASLGTRLHEAAEQRILFGEGASVDAEVQPFVDQYLRWERSWKPIFKASEMTVISRKWGYAGTLDWIAQFAAGDLPDSFKDIAGRNVLGDNLTGKSIVLQKGWQVCAYSHADVVLLPDGSEEPLPEIGAGLVLHIRPNQVQVRRVDIAAKTHQNFIHLLRAVEGLNAGLNSVLSRPFTMKEN